MESYRFLLAGTLVVMLPLAVTPLTPSSDSIKELLLALLAGAAVFGLAIAGLRKRAWCWTKHPVILALLAFFVVCALSAAISPHKHASAVEAGRLLLLAIVFDLGFHLGQGHRNSLRIARLVALSAAVVAAYGVLQRLGLDPIVWQDAPRGRASSFCGHPNLLAAYLVFSLPLTVALVIGAGGVIAASFASVSLVLQTACLVFTFSRGGWIAAGAAGVLFASLGLTCRSAPGTPSFRRVAFCGALLCLAAISAFAIGSDYRPLSSDPSKAASVSIETRKLIYQGTLEMLSHKPVLGWGLGAFNTVFPEFRPHQFATVNPRLNVLHAHSEVLETAAETGIIGILALAGFVVMALRSGFMTLQQREEGRLVTVGLFAGVCGVLLQGAMDQTLRFALPSSHLWLGLGLLAGGRAVTVKEVPLHKALRIVLPVLFAAAVAVAVYQLNVRPFLSQVEELKARMSKAKGEWQAATVVCDRAITLDPWNLAARYEKAICLVELERYEEALAEYQSIEQLEPNYVQIHYNMGMIHIFKHEWPQALARLQKADRVGSLPVDFVLGEAEETIRSSLDSDAKEASLFKTIADARFRDEARLQAVKLKSLEPSMAALGTGYLTAGKVKRAEALFELALAQRPDDRVVLNNLAGIYFQRKEYSRAIEVYERLVGADPNDVVACLNLAGTLMTTGARDKAEKVLESLLQRNPGCKQAQQLLERVRRKR